MNAASNEGAFKSAAAEDEAAANNVAAEERSPDRLAMERKRLQADAVGGSLWTSVQTLVSLPLAVGANVVVAQMLGATAYGTLAVYLTIYAIAVSLLNAGVSDATVQWVATHIARREMDAALTAVRRCSGYHVYVQAPLVGLLAAGLLREAGSWAMAIGASAAVATVVIGTGTVVLSGLGLTALAARLSIALTLALQSTLVVTAITAGTPGAVFAGRISATFLGPAIALFFIPRMFRQALFRPLFPRRWPPGFLGNGLRTCAFGVVTTLVFGRSELFVFQAYGLYEAAGLFALAAGVAGLITAPIDALLGPLLPATAGLLATTPERAGNALLRGLRTTAVLAGLVAAVGIPVLAPLLPSIYGSSFQGAQVPFIALALLSCTQSVGNPVLAFLLAARRTGSLLKVSLLFVVLDLAVAGATIPWLGLYGAVLASGIAQLGVLLVTAHRVGRILGTPARRQATAASFFLDATLIALTVLLLQALVLDAAPIIEAVFGLTCSLLALAVFGRIRRSSGLAQADADVILNALPRPLAAVFRLVVRLLALDQRPGRQAI